ncbi:MAG: hypothetical protein V7603_5052 [Micromonosporaceae bacterium]
MSEQAQAARSGSGPVAVGDRVISWYDDEPVEYGGPDSERGGWSTLSFAPMATGLPVRKCDLDRVAPADTPVSATDSRVSVEKRPRSEMPYGQPGVWRLTLPGVAHPSWHRTKRDATATGLRRLAILDWHAGTIPAGPVALPHTGMTVPHTRLGMRKLRAMPTSDGEAYTAELVLDGKPVGTIENTGQGGATIWFPLNRELFDWQAMAAFVAQCRDEDGEPMAEEFVLADLFEEARTARDIARYVKAGKIPVRTLAAITRDGEQVAATFADAYYGVSGGWGENRDRLAAGMWRQRPKAHAIQMWTGQRWEPLPRPAAPLSGMVQVVLPTTGYVVLHTSQRDGQEPVHATTFIGGAAGGMDDPAAIAHVTAELGGLAEHAPCDVLHTLRLVHRTSAGDRVLLTPDPVRGAGAALPD